MVVVRRLNDDEGVKSVRVPWTEMSGVGERDGATVVRLLRETIVQLCRANTPFGGGRVEIDGIICITGPASGQQIVVKVHEVLHDPSPGPSHPGGGGVFDRGDRCLAPVDHASTAPDLGGVDVKRRRLDATMATFNGGLPVLPVSYTHLTLPTILRV